MHEQKKKKRARTKKETSNPHHVQTALEPLRRQAARWKILTFPAQTRRSTFNFLSILRTIPESLSHTCQANCTMATSTAESQGLEVENKATTSRRKSTLAQRRKSTAVIDEASAAILEGHELSDADRRLAEMGYVQVSLD